MKLSPRGLDLIKEFEGYHRALPDGSCVAYRCPAGVLTIGYGCTEGVREGMRWTKADAEARLLAELSRHEAAVTRLTTVELNQNQFDALVSFSYNLGEGALKRSALLAAVNAGQWETAGQAFGLWTRAAGKVLPGLVARRGREAALFCEPAMEPLEPAMPQRLDVPAVATPRPLTRSGTVIGGIGGIGATAAGFADQSLAAGLEWIAALTEMAPIKAALLEAGANARSLALGLGVWAASLVIARRVKAAQEGKAG